MLFGMLIAHSHNNEIWIGALRGINCSQNCENYFEKFKRLCLWG